MRFLLLVLVVAIWRSTNAGQTPGKTVLQFRTNDELPEELFVGFDGGEWMDEQQVDKQQLDSNGFQLEATFHDCIKNDSEWNEQLCPIQIGTEEQAKLFNTIIYQMVSFIPIRVDKLGLGCRSDAGLNQLEPGQRELLRKMKIKHDLIDISKVSFSNGNWFVSDILRSLNSEFEDYATIWNELFKEVAGATLEEKLKNFLQDSNPLYIKMKSYIEANYLVLMIRVIGAFSGNKEFPREAITYKGYDLLKLTNYVSKETEVKIPNHDELNYIILKIYVNLEVSQKLDEVAQKFLLMYKKRLSEKKKKVLFFPSYELYDGIFERLMLCFGPCHARSSVIEAMIARQQKIGLVVSKVLRNDWKIDLKLIVNRRYVIPFPNGDASGNLYRTVPHVDGMILNAVQERQLSAYEPKIFEFIVHNKYCPAILLTQLYMGEFQQNSKYEKARQQTSVSVDIGFLKKKLEEISRSPTISKTFLESIS